MGRYLQEIGREKHISVTKYALGINGVKGIYGTVQLDERDRLKKNCHYYLGINMTQQVKSLVITLRPNCYNF